MSEDSNDILYDIGMQLYDEFNDKIATMNDYLGDIYSLRDVEEVENAKKEKEIELLRIAVIKQQKEIEELKNADLTTVYLNGFYDGEKKVKDKIKAKIEECDMKNLTICYGGRSQGRTFQQAVRTEVKKILQSLLEKE